MKKTFLIGLGAQNPTPGTGPRSGRPTATPRVCSGSVQNDTLSSENTFSVVA